MAYEALGIEPGSTDGFFALLSEPVAFVLGAGLVVLVGALMNRKPKSEELHVCRSHGCQAKWDAPMKSLYRRDEELFWLDHYETAHPELAGLREKYLIR